MRSIFLITCLLISGSAFCQLSKGAILVGGSLNASYDKTEDGKRVPSWSWTKQSIFSTSISPSIGFFTSDTWMTGFGLSYSYGSSSAVSAQPLGGGGWIEFSSKSKSNLFSANVFMRKYIQLKGGLFFTLNFSAQGGISISKQEYENADQEIKANTYQAGLSITPGLTYFINNRWAVTSTLGIAQATFAWRNPEKESSGPENFSANVNLSLRANTFTVGLQYFLRNGQAED